MTDREIFLNIPEGASPSELRAYLERMCGEDVELRARVESLMAAHEGADAQFLRASPLQRNGERPPAAVAAEEEPTILDAEAGSSDAERFAPGVILAERYRIVSLLGRGGMGEVYRADDLKLRLPVALKFLPQELSGNRRLLDALFNEVRQARRVSHRHVCRVHDVGETEGQHFLTMELIEGDDLGALLRQIGRLSRSKALDLALQLCAGLEAAHEEGLLHLDLKPGNLMINEEGELRITDFGLARLADEAAQTTCRAGTPTYMAPEQMRSGQVSPQSDVYAVGLILYEMLTGRCFHGARSREKMVSWHLSGKQPESLSELDGLLEPEVGQLVLRCLRSHPAERPKTVAELVGDLEALQAAGPKEAADRYGTAAGSGKSLVALMCTKIVGGVELQQRLGTEAYMRYVARHDQLVHACLEQAIGARTLNQPGDGFLVRFSDPVDAVKTALRIQARLCRECAEGEALRVRIGLHLGVVAEMEETTRGEKRAIGLPISVAALVMELADGGQILMTRNVYEDARNDVREYPGMGAQDGAPALQWLSHGFYDLAGAPAPLEIFEVGAEGIAPLRPPEDSRLATRLESGQLPSGRTSEIRSEPSLPSVEVLEGSDVFLGYSPIDDQALQPAGEGWVSNFHRNLEVRLQQLTGEPLQIWRGRWSPEEDQPDQEVVQRLPSVRAMVSVISPPFVKSNRCRSEVAAFLSDPAAPEEIAPQRAMRVVKAVKRPVPSTEVAPPISEVLCDRGGIEFFDRDSDSGKVREFDEAFGERARQRYQERIYDLAQEVCSVLQDVPDATGGGRKKVFLAMPTYELQDAYDAVRRVLLEKGHTVLPDRPLPMEAAALEHDVRAHLQECDLALHLFGNSYGSIPENAHQSLAELQYRIADEESRTQGFQRLMWIPRDLHTTDERQQKFLSHLEEEGLGDEGVDLIRGTVSLFKEVLVRRLSPEEEKADAQPNAGGEARPRRIYLICDRQDEDAVEPLEDYLFEKGLEVSLPDFEADQDEFSQNHRENLVDCDAVLVYFGAGRKAWVDIKLRDVLKAIGYGRKEPIRHLAVYVAPPEDRRKDRFRTHSGRVIRQGGETFGPDDQLEAFVAAVLEKGEHH